MRYYPLADVSFSTESMVVVGTLLAALTGAVSLLFRQLIATKDDALKAMTSQRDSYREMADEAIKNLEKAVNDGLKLSGRPPFAVVPPVVPEHSSPTTERQQDVADMQTMRARLVAATLALRLPAREASQEKQ